MMMALKGDIGYPVGDFDSLYNLMHSISVQEHNGLVFQT